MMGSTGTAITMLLFLWVFHLQGQDKLSYIDLGTDTVMYDRGFEYVAAFEMERYMESFVFYRTAMEAYQRGDYLSAGAAVSKAIKLNRNEVRFKMLKAWIFSREKSYKKAIKLTSRMLEDHPANQEALYCKALNQFLLNDFLGANITYSSLIDINDEDARAYYGRAEARVKMEDYEGAIVDFSSAIALDPAMDPAYEGRAMAYFRIFDFRNAVRDFNQFLVARPDSGKGYHFRGLAHLRLSEFSQACKSFEEAVKLKFKDSGEYFAKYCNF
jgi:tetratricopeptide (TPR) repeat protein